MSGGGGTNTVVQNSQPPAQFLNAYTNLLGTANNVVANQPTYQPYTGNTVAGLTPDQQMGITGLEGTAGGAGIASPFIGAAENNISASVAPLAPTIAPEVGGAQGFIQAGGAPVSAGNIAQFENPYTQQVVQSTEQQFNNQNAQQQEQLQGQAAQQGAFGGDRQAVEAGITAGQQQTAEAPVIAGVESQGFNTALTAAMQQKQLEQQAAQGETGIGNLELGANEANAWLSSQAGYGMANLGNEAVNQQLSSDQALLGAGGLEQSVQQEQLNVPYENYIASQAYPFQTTSWLGGLTEGLGGAAGGTSSTQYPGASIGSQITGAGITGLGLYGLANQTGALSGIGGLIGGGAGIAGDTGAFTEAAAMLPETMLIARGGGVPHRAFGGGITIPHINNMRSNVVPFRRPANDIFSAPHMPHQRAVGMGHFDSGGGITGHIPRRDDGGDLPIGFEDLVMPHHVDDAGGTMGLRRDAHDEPTRPPGVKVPTDEGHGGIAPPPDVSVGSPDASSRWQDSAPPLGVAAATEAGGIAPPETAGNRREPPGEGMPPPPIRPAGFTMTPPTATPPPSGGGGIAPLEAGPAPGPQAGPPGPVGGEQPMGGGAPPTGALAGMGGADKGTGKMPWETLIAMGLGIMGGRSPQAGVNIGEGGLKGMEFGEQVRAREENVKLRELQQEELSQWHQATAGNTRQRNDIYAARVQGQTGVDAARAAWLQEKANNPGVSQAQLQQQVMTTLMHTTNPDTGQPFTQDEAFQHVRGFQYKQQANDLALAKAIDTHNFHQATVAQKAEAQKALETWRNAGRVQTTEWHEYLKSHYATDEDIRTALGTAAATGTPPKAGAAHDTAETMRQQNTPGGGGGALPMPKSAADAVAGQVYNTNRGPARWDGQQFIPLGGT